MSQTTLRLDALETQVAQFIREFNAKLTVLSARVGR
jgi:hypothetical protein